MIAAAIAAFDEPADDERQQTRCEERAEGVVEPHHGVQDERHVGDAEDERHDAHGGERTGAGGRAGDDVGEHAKGAAGGDRGGGDMALSPGGTAPVKLDGVHQ